MQKRFTGLFAVALLLFAAAVALAGEYKILKPTGELDDAVRVGKRILPVREEPVVRLSPTPGFMDTLVYNTDLYYYNPNRLTNDTTVVWFSPAAECSLMSMRMYFYSEGNAQMFAWYAPEFVWGDTSKFAYVPGKGLGSTADSTDLIGGPVPMSSTTAGWVQIDFPTPIDVGTRDFFLGFVYTEDGYPQTGMDAQGSYTPARSYQYRNSTSNWRKYDLNYSGGDFLIQAIVYIYGNPPPEIAHSKLPDTYGGGPYPVTATITDMPDNAVDWARVHFKINSAAWDSTDLTGTYPDYAGQLPAASVDDTVYYYFNAADDSGKVGYGPPTGADLPYSFVRRAPTPGNDVLIVDEGDSDELPYYQAYFDIHYPHYDLWSTTDYGGIDSTVIWSSEYEAIVWPTYSGAAFGTVTDAVAAYLDLGKHLLLTGFDVPDYGLGYGYGDYTTLPGEFAHDYLHILGGTGDYVGGATEYEDLYGVDADPLTGFLFPGPFYIYSTLLLGFDNWRGIVTTDATPIVYDLGGNVCGLRNDGTTYKLVFLYWPIGAITDTLIMDADSTAQVQLLNNIMTWFGIPWVTGVAGDDPAGQPKHVFALYQNRPNPFGSSTAIQYSLPASGSVKVAVYNVAGELVKTLVDSRESAGTHTITWNGRDSQGRQVANGVYFCKLAANGTEATRRAVMVR
jgi:hypothetical protein